MGMHVFMGKIYALIQFSLTLSSLRSISMSNLNWNMKLLEQNETLVDSDQEKSHFVISYSRDSEIGGPKISVVSSKM